MSSDRFDELLSLYVDGRATDAELAELEDGMRSDPGRRRAFVERVRLDVGLTALYESAAEAAASSAPSRPARAPRREKVAAPGFLRPAYFVAAGLFIAALLMLVLRDRGPVPVESRRTETAKVEAPEDPRRAAEEERTRAEGETRRSEERLAAIQRRESAVVPGAAAAEESKAPADEVLARLRAEREAAEAELKEARERERRAAEEVERRGKAAEATAPRPKSPETRPQLATLERIEGDVRVQGRPVPASGQPIYAGDGLETAGRRSVAVLAFPDHTRMEVAGDSLVREFSDARVVLEKGAVSAEVARRPKDRPLVFSTPHGEAKVLGTVLRVSVDPDPKRGTSLEVQEGKVELRASSGKSVVVDAGHQAAIAAGAPLAAKPLPRDEVLLAMDLEDGKLPASVETGTLEAGPARPGNRWCLSGSVESIGVSRIFIGDGGLGLFAFTGDEVLSFDYWTDLQAGQVNFNFWDRARKVAHEGAVPKLVVGKWTHVTVRLADLGDADTRLRAGDWLANFYIQSTGGGTSRRFYLDNLLITRTRTLKPRSK
jgi:hypothetical protein